MNARKIGNQVFWMGVIDWKRRLFDSLIPLHDGTSYNAYLIKGNEKTALLDTVDPAETAKLMQQLENVSKLDYLISHHAEQDHSGSIPAVLDKYPDAKLVCSEKAEGMLMDLLKIDSSRIITVKDGETLSLGDKTLEFIYTPWVHWPETMVTYLKEDKILFSCDFFGSHYATTELYTEREGIVYEAAKRYYAEIMMPFRNVIRKNLVKLENKDIHLIAPSHGPVYKQPGFIVEAYKDWVSEEVKNEVVLPYISMHGSTEKMVDFLTGKLSEKGIKVHLFDLAVTDLGKLAISLVDAATIVIGTPTVHVGPHPAVFYASHLANALRPKLRYASVIGSFGWNSKTVERIAELIPNLKVDIIPPVMSRGYPVKQDFKALTELAEAISDKHKSLIKT